MIEARDQLLKTMTDLKAGKCPQDVAEITHKLGHSIAQNGFEEVKREKALNDTEIAKGMSEAQERIKSL